MQPKRLDFSVPNPADTAAPYRHVACTQWGNPKANRTILCVHGLTRTGRDFDFLARTLAHDYHVLCPDMPGRGESQWLSNPLGYANPAYVADIAFILRSLNITRVSWVGTSMGGIIAMLAASALPGLIDRLVLNDIGCLIPAAGLKRIFDLADIRTSFDSREEAEAAYRQRCATFGITSEAHWKHLFTYGIHERNGRFHYNYDPAIFAASPPKGAPLADIDFWPMWLPLTQIPLLVVRGEHSDILPKSVASDMQKGHPRLTLHEVPGVGHAPTLMEDKEIALIHKWISAKQETS